MQIVIDIPEDTYKATCNESMLPPDVKNVVDAITNGIPLPQEPRNTKCDRCPYGETRVVNICNYDGDGCGWD